MALQYEVVEIKIDKAVAEEGDASTIVQPIWWTANIYDGPDEYDLSLRSFTRSQRYVYAIMWYRAEVDNGGHHQFYSNSTGVVWKDALSGLEEMKLHDYAEILRNSASLLGGSPSLEHEIRSQQLEAYNPEFRSVDDRFYDLNKKTDLYESLCDFIRSRPSEFFFEGKIRRAILPKFND